MLLRYSFKPRPNSRVQKPVWRERTKVWAAATAKGWCDFGGASFYPPFKKRKGGSASRVPLHTMSCKCLHRNHEHCMHDISDGVIKSLPKSPKYFSFSDWFKSQRSFVITRHGWPRKDFFKYFIIDVNCWASYAVGKPFSSWTDSQILKLKSARAFNGSKSGTTLLPNRHFSLNQYWL